MFLRSMHGSTLCTAIIRDDMLLTVMVKMSSLYGTFEMSIASNWNKYALAGKP